MRTVLLIDDDPGIAELIRRGLAETDLELHVATNGRDGVTRARQLRPDLVLMDITMPEMDGYTATAEIRRTPGLEQTTVVFISGLTASEDGGRSFALGGLALLRKPFPMRQLREIVQMALDAR